MGCSRLAVTKTQLEAKFRAGNVSFVFHYFVSFFLFLFIRIYLDVRLLNQNLNRTFDLSFEHSSYRRYARHVAAAI